MLYELFSSLAVGGLTWWKWAVGVVVGLYIIHILALLLFEFVNQCYSYIHDGEKGLGNCYILLIIKILSPGANPDLIPDGWYNTHGYYYRCKITSGIVTEVADGHSEEAVNHPLITSVYGSLSKVGCIVTPSGPGGGCDHQLALVFGPLFIAACFLLLDYFPVAAASLATLYGVLRTTRSLVRGTKKTTKRLDTLEEGMTGANSGGK